MLKGGGLFGWFYPPSTDINSSSDYHSFNPAAIAGLSSGSLLKTRLFVSPVIISGAKTFNRIGFRFAGASGCKARIGLWNCSTTNFRPSTLIVESTELSGSNNTNVEYTISPSITLKNSIYWVGLIPELDTTILTFGSYDLSFSNYMGNVYNSSMSSLNNRFYVDFTYAALPSDLSTYTIKVETSQNAPLVWLRNA